MLQRRDYQLRFFNNKRINNHNTNQLEREIEQLEKQKQKLLNEIQDIDEKDEFATGETYTKYFINLYYKRLPLEYLASIFFTKRDVLLPMINANFDEFMLHQIVEYLEIDEKESAVMSIAMHCEAALPSDKGPILVLSDPYKTIRTKPLVRIDYDTAIKWIGRVVIAKIIITKNAKMENIFELKGIKLLKYTLKGIIDPDGKETKIVPNIELFNEYKGITGYNQCIQALSRIEKDLKCKGYLVNRENDHTLRFRKDDLISIIIYKNNRLEYIYQKDKPLNSFDQGLINTELEYSLLSVDSDYEH